MAKEIENKVCIECDSSYRIVYNLDETSGFLKFCPFCSAEVNQEEELLLEEDDE